MGRAKAAMMEHEENLALAVEYLERQGILERCEYHDEIYGGGWDLEADFFKDAMANRNRGKNGPIPWAITLQAREFTDLLKEANEQYMGDRCGYCAKNAAS